MIQPKQGSANYECDDQAGEMFHREFENRAAYIPSPSAGVMSIRIIDPKPLRFNEAITVVFPKIN
jgi:hypothetical protein